MLPPATAGLAPPVRLRHALPSGSGVDPDGPGRWPVALFDDVRDLVGGPPYWDGRML